MSVPTTTHAAGGLEGLSLGAPIGGGSHPTPATGGLSSTSHTSSTGHGLTGANSGLTGNNTGLTGSNSGLTGSHDHHHSGSNTGLTGGVLGDAKNSTSGDRGIGGGHGGPTAFESNPADVGTDRRHDGPGSHSLGNHGTSGLTSGTGSHVDREGDLHKSSLGAKASDLKDGSSSTHGHNNHGGLAAGGLAAGGVGAGSAALVSGLGDRNHTSPQEGLVGDSITGQQHFAGTGSTGLATGAHSGSSHHHTGAGAAGLTGAGVGGVAATGVSPATLAHKSEHGHSHNKEGGMVSELKQELKDHQKSGGYSDSDKHVESEGPHGLVWDSKSNKYVHRRELDNHGSTGVPLK